MTWMSSAIMFHRHKLGKKGPHQRVRRGGLGIFLFSVATFSIATFSNATWAIGDDSGTSPDAPAKRVAQAPNKGAKKSVKMPGVTPEREAAVMTFVERHHPELRELLLNLQRTAPKQYEAAIRDLFRTTERLAQVQERDEERYEHELRMWQLQSRIHLLTARINMDESPELYAQIEEALQERHQLQLSALRAERDRVAERLQKLDEQVSRLERDRSAAVKSQLAAIRAARKSVARDRVGPKAGETKGKGIRPNGGSPASPVPDSQN